MPAKQSIYGYFSKLNPIAEKISTDINEVKLAYDHVWLTLTVMEQEKILNDTLIRPEISTQYFKGLTRIKKEDTPVLGKECQTLEKENTHNSKAKAQKTHAIYSIDGQSLLTFIRQNIGWKLLHDEHHIGNFGDEHSFPFCHRTKSQINLLGSVSFPDVATTAGNVALSNPKHIRLDSKPSSQQTNVQVCNLDEPVEEQEVEHLYSVGKQELLFNSSCMSSESTDSETDYGSAHSQLLPAEVQIPKGFDFLSNW